MTDRGELEFREAVVEWAEITYREVRTIRQVVVFFFTGMASMTAAERPSSASS